MHECVHTPYIHLQTHPPTYILPHTLPNSSTQCLVYLSKASFAILVTLAFKELSSVESLCETVQIYDFVDEV